MLFPKSITRSSAFQPFPIALVLKSRIVPTPPLTCPKGRDPGAERRNSHQQLFSLTNVYRCIYACVCICFFISLLSFVSLFIPAAVSWRPENHFGFCSKPELGRRCRSPGEGKKEDERSKRRKLRKGQWENRGVCPCGLDLNTRQSNRALVTRGRSVHTTRTRCVPCG